MTRLSRGEGLRTSNGAASRELVVMPPPPKGDTSLAKRRAAGDAGRASDLPEFVTMEQAHRAIVAGGFLAGSLVAFLWGTGARVSEALAVTPADLEISRRMVKLPTLKRRRKDGRGRLVSAARMVPVAGHHLTSVLAYVVEAQRAPSERIWNIGRQHAWRLVSAALRDAGVEPRRAKPHALRHGHAVHAVLAGVPLNLIQRQLGHASIVTTSIYLRITGQDVRKAYDETSW